MVIRMSSFKDDIEKLAAQWDKALAQGIFDDNKDKQSQGEKKEINFFGQMPTVDDTEIKDTDVVQWKDFLGVLNGRESFHDESENILTEGKAPSKKKIKSHNKKMANTNNPVYPNTIGKDSKIKPENEFTNGKLLDELTELKKKFHAMLADMHRDEALGKDVKKFEASVEKISKEIDKLSDALNGSIIDNK